MPRRNLSPINIQPNLEGVEVAQPRRLIAFGWYGGKFNHVNWLLPLLPECHHYCEPFSGSAAVLLSRPPSPVERGSCI
jgi:DNA adenine methylase